MADDTSTETASQDSTQTDPPTTTRTTTRRRTTTKVAAPSETPGQEPTSDAPVEDISAERAAAKKTTAKKTTTKKTAAKKTAAKSTAKKAAAKSTAKKAAATTGTETAGAAQPQFQPEPSAESSAGESGSAASDDGAAEAPGLVFQPPPAERAPRKRTTKPASADAGEGGAADQAGEKASDDSSEQGASEDGADGEETDGQGGQRRRRRRGGRRRGRKGGSGGDADQDGEDGADSGASDDKSDETGADSAARGGTGKRDGGKADDKGGKADDKGDKADSGEADSGEGDGGSSSSRRRRRRRRAGENGEGSSDDPDNTVTRVRSARSAEDEITAFTGSTRLEAKKQRRREGREAGRRRAPVISEAEFLARRESVERSMVIRQRKDLTQIAVLEDNVLVEHYVARESQTSLIGNVYLGKVQNVLPSMEAAFIDIGRGRNAVLYAGEVNWDALGAGNVSGKDRKIEQVLKPGQAVLVQVTKDPVGHKGARLTSQISLPGRFLVYVPEGNTSGISRKLPDSERTRLKNLLKEIVPSEAGVIVRTAAEGAAEEELRRDVARLKARWEDISGKVGSGSPSAPQELYSEPDLTLKVVRDLFTEDFKQLIVSGDDAWHMVHTYVEQMAPDLAERLSKHDDSEGDAFSAYRIDEQINKALDRKVWLPSGGSLIIDRTEAMTVVDVNTGKFTGSGGNLEETVTKNNLEAAEEIVRQLRLRDIGGIIVIDFIDMVLESNRELVLRRLIECLGRDRTRHQVAEVTSLGLVQMTRKRIGTGLLEAFSETCEHCQGRGVHVHAEPVEQKKARQDDEPRRGRRGGRSGKSDDDKSGKGAKQSGSSTGDKQDDSQSAGRRPTPAEFAAMAAHREDEADEADGAGEGAGTDDAQKQPSAERPAAQEPAEKDGSAQPETAAEESAPAQPEDTTENTTENTTEDTAAEEPVAEPAPAPVDSTPRIVTSTRRRGATRAAGPPRTGGDEPGAAADADTAAEAAP